MVEWDVHCETDASMSVSNKSLTDMLASVGESVSDGEKHPLAVNLTKALFCNLRRVSWWQILSCKELMMSALLCSSR